MPIYSSREPCAVLNYLMSSDVPPCLFALLESVSHHFLTGVASKAALGSTIGFVAQGPSLGSGPSRVLASI